MRSLRPTGWRRVRVRAGPTDRLEDSPEGRQPDLHRVRPGSGTHPHADQFCLCSGGPAAGYVNPRCRDGEIATAGTEMEERWCRVHRRSWSKTYPRIYDKAEEVASPVRQAGWDHRWRRPSNPTYVRRCRTGIIRRSDQPYRCSRYDGGSDRSTASLFVLLTAHIRRSGAHRPALS